MLTLRGAIKLGLAGLLSGNATITYPFWEAMARPRVQTYRLTPSRWTPGLSLKICVLADIHACRPWMEEDRIARICEQAQALDADLILLLGDYMPGIRRFAEPLAPQDWARPLGALRAPLGVHAVLGNHDYPSHPAARTNPSLDAVVTRALRDVGVSVYINEAVKLEKNGHSFWLAGLGDQLALVPREEGGRTHLRSLADLPATLSAVSDEAPVILMAHEPDIFLTPDPRVSLTLSGHTHGGQFNLFGWRPFSNSYGSQRYPAGRFRSQGTDLIVSRGLGCSAVPMRIGAWPEILLIELG